MKKEGNQLTTNCRQLKMIAEDGKNRATDVADTEQLLLKAGRRSGIHGWRAISRNQSHHHKRGRP
ncbi:MAG: hypothetical protein ACRKFN_09845 [Desulfitobacterium sp.]